MGYQLWTSPITGNRRQGTRLAELRRHFEDSITADAILEPLKSCPSGADAVEMATLLLARDFDVAGVQEIEGGPIIGFVRQEDLKQGGHVHAYRRDLTSSELIADSTPLATCLSVLSQTPIVFVLIGDQVRGVLTQWDLNKPAVRIYLFGILTLLELHITFWIRATHENDSWEKNLSKRSLAKAQELHASKKTRVKIRHSWTVSHWPIRST